MKGVSPVSSVSSVVWIWTGLAIMIVSEAATLAHLEPFWSWNTPIAWTGFIIFADAIVFRARGDSWLRSAPREFFRMTLASIPLWLVFEFFNLYIDNWHYVGLPENVWLRMFGYAWSFATITPAIFEAAELIAVWRGKNKGTVRLPATGRASGWKPDPTYRPHPPDPPDPPVLPALSVAAGAIMLASPFAVSPEIARYLAAPVWLGFILLLDPINDRLGGESLLRDARAGRFDRLVNLSLSGLLCGVLWEGWNFWARAKWHYTVPIMEELKIFEMPVPGYLGFPAFAIECFTMYVCVRLAASRLAGARGGAGRPIAL